MLKIITVLLSSFFFLSTTAIAEEVPESVKQLSTSLAEWGKNPILIEAVEAQNNKKISLSDIQSLDKTWISTTGVDDFMKSLLGNTAAKELLHLEATKPYYSELFLMDNQGANVAMTNRTSDYWQGDEAKFTKSFADGKGAIHIGKVKFDKSSQAYLVQVSVPVMKSGSAIGALTIGVNLDELEK